MYISESQTSSHTHTPGYSDKYTTALLYFSNYYVNLYNYIILFVVNHTEV